MPRLTALFFFSQPSLISAMCCELRGGGTGARRTAQWRRGPAGLQKKNTKAPPHPRPARKCRDRRQVGAEAVLPDQRVLGIVNDDCVPRDLKQEQGHAARMAVAALWLAWRIRQEPATLGGSGKDPSQDANVRAPGLRSISFHQPRLSWPYLRPLLDPLSTV